MIFQLSWFLNHLHLYNSCKKKKHPCILDFREYKNSEPKLLIKGEEIPT